MNEFYNFLNHQNGNRLFWYGLVILIALYIIVKGLALIFDAIFSAFKRSKK